MSALRRSPRRYRARVKTGIQQIVFGLNGALVDLGRSIG